MSLIVEDGTGKSDAESYISVADADTYFSNRGDTVWDALETAAKEESLRKSTDYMEQVYRESWQGGRVFTTQALSWPRYSVLVDGFYIANDEVPDDVANACAILALKASAAELSPDLTQAKTKSKVGPIAVEYNNASPQYTRYRSVDNMLIPYLDGYGGISRGLDRV